jgi:MFS family permease
MASIRLPEDAEPSNGRFGASTVSIVAYALTLASMATVGVVVPLMAQMATLLGASMTELGFAIGLFSVPAAFLSVFSGGIVDRMGPKQTLMLSALLAMVADILIYQAHSLLVLEIGLFVAGIANTGVITAVPALLMTALSGDERIRAMLVLIAVTLFAGVAAAIVLPNPPAQASRDGSGSFGAILSILRNLPMVRLCAAYGVAASVSYGSSLAAPGYLSRVYDVSIASSATAIAAAKIVAMLLGGVGMGWLLSRSKERIRILVVIAAKKHPIEAICPINPAATPLLAGSSLSWDRTTKLVAEMPPKANSHRIIAPVARAMPLNGT